MYVRRYLTSVAAIGHLFGWTVMLLVSTVFFLLFFFLDFIFRRIFFLFLKLRATRALLRLFAVAEWSFFPQWLVLWI